MVIFHSYVSLPEGTNSEELFTKSIKIHQRNWLKTLPDMSLSGDICKAMEAVVSLWSNKKTTFLTRHYPIPHPFKDISI